MELSNADMANMAAKAVSPKLAHMELHGIVFARMDIPYVVVEGTTVKTASATVFLVRDEELIDKIQRLVNGEDHLVPEHKPPPPPTLN